MHTENIRRILRTCMAGGIFIASALLVIYFGPWLFASPPIPFQFLLLIWDLFPTDVLLKISVVAIIFAALIGISKKWWWGIAICLCFPILGFATDFNPSNALDTLIPSLILMLCLCIFAGLLLFTTRFPGWINPSRKIVRHFLELAMVLILISAGLFFSRVLSADKPVLFVSAYKIAQTNNWQIQKMEISNFLGDYYDTIHFHLSDGSTKNCLYDHFFAEEYGFAHMFDLKNMSDAQDVIICPD